MDCWLGSCKPCVSFCKTATHHVGVLMGIRCLGPKWNPYTRDLVRLAAASTAAGWTWRWSRRRRHLRAVPLLAEAVPRPSRAPSTTPWPARSPPAARGSCSSAQPWSQRLWILSPATSLCSELTSYIWATPLQCARWQDVGFDRLSSGRRNHYI